MKWRTQYPNPHLTGGAKGKAYTNVKHDRRQEPRRKNMLGQVNMEKASNTQRNVLPGFADLKHIWRGMNEELETNYKKEALEELKILENNIEIQKIVENLDKKQDQGKNGKV